jgi:hypothetical protein
MFLLEKTVEKTRMTAPAPLGPGFNPIQASRAAIMEIYCSSFRDTTDECLFVLRGEDGTVVAEQRVGGY